MDDWSEDGRGSLQDFLVCALNVFGNGIGVNVTTMVISQSRAYGGSRELLGWLNHCDGESFVVFIVSTSFSLQGLKKRAGAL